jgi:hypothetical protein
MQRRGFAAIQALGALDGPGDHPEGPIAASWTSAADIGSPTELDAPDLVVSFVQTLLVSPDFAPHPFDGRMNVLRAEAVAWHGW